MYVFLEPGVIQDLLFAFTSESLTHVFDQQLGDKVPKLVAMIFARLVRNLKPLVNNYFIYLLYCCRLEWFEAEHQLVADQTDCPPVRCEGIRLAFDHFGRLILGRPYRFCSEETFSIK